MCSIRHFSCSTPLSLSSPCTSSCSVFPSLYSPSTLSCLYPSPPSPFLSLNTNAHLLVLGPLEVGLQVVLASADHLAHLTAVVHRSGGSGLDRGGHAHFLFVALTYQVGLEILYRQTDRQTGLHIKEICAVRNVCARNRYMSLERCYTHTHAHKQVIQ